MFLSDWLALSTLGAFMGIITFLKYAFMEWAVHVYEVDKRNSADKMVTMFNCSYVQNSNKPINLHTK